MKKSKIRRLVSKKAARQFVASNVHGEQGLADFMRREAGGTISKMKAKGYEVVTFLESGEGVFVRDEDVVGLHIQLPGPLYDRLCRECTQRGATKRSLVVAALESWFSTQDDGDGSVLGGSGTVDPDSES